MKNIIIRGFIFCLSVLCPFLNIAQTHPGDSLELVDFYHSACLEGCNLVWDFSQPVSTWQGIYTSNGRVTKIYIFYTFNLDGTLTDLNLTELTELNLRNQSLHGTIPNFNLPNLLKLILDRNQLSGTIPDFNLPNVIDIEISNNNLTGDIPNFSNLPNVEYIGLSFNNFASQIPNFTSLLSLKLLRLANNSLVDTIPDFSGLVSIEEIQFNGNNLTGTLPNFSNTPNLQYIYLRNNDISGQIPDFSNLPNLTYLDLDYNNIGGTIPDFTNLENLIHIRVYNNQLTGTVPDFSNLPNLVKLHLSRNLLTGAVPNFTNLGNLTHITIENNQLTGSVPDFSNMPNLQVIGLGNNNLSGEVPNFNHNNLYQIYLNDNQLTGDIPNFSSQSLTGIRLSNNSLDGSIPPLNLPNLVTLELQYNNLTGLIPNFNLPKLIYLELEVNDLTGTISNFNAPKLVEFTAQGNNLTGAIPNFNMPNLEYLNFNGNSLSDSLPTFEYLLSLEELSLIGNELTGNIPDFTNSPNLHEVYIYDNNFTGVVPDLSSLDKLHINLNKFSFHDIYVNFPVNQQISDFKYSSQLNGEIQYHLVEFGDTLVLKLSTPMSGDNSNVSYKWYRNSTFTGNTDSMFIANDFQLDSIGIYRLSMTDTSRIPDLLIVSEYIYVTSPGYDFYGQPVTYNQIMVEFDTEYDRQSYENEHLYPNAGWVQDSCSCNRGLYLWQFPSDSVALQVLLDINTKTESQENEADVDGGSNNIFDLGISNNSGTAWSWTGDYEGFTYQDSVKVFMLDSGLDEGNWNASPYLMPDAPKDSCYNIAASGYDYTDSLVTFTADYIDSLGHGTFGFRSVVEGLNDYMDIKSVPLKVFDQSGQGTLFKFICALYHAIDHDADVINISAGYRGQPSEILEEAIQLAQQKGIFIVTAAGNDGVNIDSSPQFPAYFSGTTYEREIDDIIYDIPYDNVISVASINAQDSLSVFSNYGSNNTTLAAYGENMSGYGVGGVGVVSSGTSMSTFYVTRELAAEIAKDKNRSLQEIWSDFETNKLVHNPPTYGLTKTGKRLDIQIVNTCLPMLLPNGDISDGIYQAGQVIDSDGTIPTDSNVQFKAGDMIILQPGFQVEPQSEFSGEIEDCDDNQ